MTICMKCQILFPRKNIINVSPAELVQYVVKVNKILIIRLFILN